MSIDQTGPGRPLNGTHSHETPSPRPGTPDTRYDDLIARLREAAGWHPEWLRFVIGRYEREGRDVTAAVLRVVADVIA